MSFSRTSREQKTVTRNKTREQKCITRNKPQEQKSITWNKHWEQKMVTRNYFIKCFYQSQMVVFYSNKSDWLSEPINERDNLEVLLELEVRRFKMRTKDLSSQEFPVYILLEEHVR